MISFLFFLSFFHFLSEYIGSFLHWKATKIGRKDKKGAIVA